MITATSPDIVQRTLGHDGTRIGRGAERKWEEGDKRVSHSQASRRGHMVESAASRWET